MKIFGSERYFHAKATACIDRVKDSLQDQSIDFKAVLHDILGSSSRMGSLIF
jgi:hypothetical protein